MAENWFQVGKIVNTHGIKGEVRVVSSTDFEDERFIPGSQLYVEGPDHNKQALTVEAVRMHKQFHLLLFRESSSINDVEWLKGKVLYVSEDQLSKLDENEYYYHEIIGCDVFEENGEKLGRIKEILSPGANDVWVVARKYKDDVLIPYIDDVVKAVDVAGKKVTVHLMDGLVDDEN